MKNRVGGEGKSHEKSLVTGLDRKKTVVMWLKQGVTATAETSIHKQREKNREAIQIIQS